MRVFQLFRWIDVKRYACEIKIQNGYSEGSIQQEESNFHQQIGLEYKEETI